MSYNKTTVECTNGMTFVTKYMGGTQTSGGKRSKKSKPTPEQKKLYNTRKAVDKLYYTLLCNFFPGDYNLAFTYPAGKVLTVAQAKETFAAFIKLYRSYCQANGYRCDYVYNTEIGKRGALHHHCIMHQHRDLEAIEEMWAKVSGGAIQYRRNSRLWANYDWRGLAEYYVDRTKGGKLPDTHIPGERRYTPSKGLKRPKVTREHIDAERWNKPRAPKGYELIPDSIRSGADELTGGNFIKYAMRRLI